MKNTEKDKNESIENLKSESAQLQKLSINNNQVTVEIKRKRIKILMLSNGIEILEEELKNIKDFFCKTENANNDLNDKVIVPLNKKEK